MGIRQSGKSSSVGAQTSLLVRAVTPESSDDWHLIQRPAELQAALADLEPNRRPPVLLAPLPSEDASDAEHWARAMSTASGSTHTHQFSARVLAAAADRVGYPWSEYFRPSR